MRLARESVWLALHVAHIGLSRCTIFAQPISAGRAQIDRSARRCSGPRAALVEFGWHEGLEPRCDAGMGLHEGGSADDRDLSHDQQQELFLLVAARLAVVQNGGPGFRRRVVAADDPANRAELLLLSPSILVPCLTHEGVRIWDTLAIAEYLNEVKPKAGLLPAERAARARCRSICGEMHSGFTNLRSALPMNLKAHRPGFKIWSGAQADIDRITTIWHECFAAHQRSLSVRELTMADAMYAPVVTRFLTYDVKLDRQCADYCERIMALPGHGRMALGRDARTRGTRRTRYGVLSLCCPRPPSLARWSHLTRAAGDRALTCMRRDPRPHCIASEVDERFEAGEALAAAQILSPRGAPATRWLSLLSRREALSDIRRDQVISGRFLMRQRNIRTGPLGAGTEPSLRGFSRSGAVRGVRSATSSRTRGISSSPY